jgi:hypothetical protein
MRLAAAAVPAGRSVIRRLLVLVGILVAAGCSRIVNLLLLLLMVVPSMLPSS